MPTVLGITDEDGSTSPDDLFQRAYGQNYDRIRLYVRRLSGDPAHAEDVTQEVFVRFWSELLDVGSPPNIRPWLFRVASNLVISGFRGRLRLIKALRTTGAALTPFSRVNIEQEALHRQVVERALRDLPEPMRRCLLLHHEGLSAIEIADIVGINPPYVRTLVFRAHERFRRSCDELGERDGLFR